MITYQEQVAMIATLYRQGMISAHEYSARYHYLRDFYTGNYRLGSNPYAFTD